MEEVPSLVKVKPLLLAGGHAENFIKLENETLMKQTNEAEILFYQQLPHAALHEEFRGRVFPEYRGIQKKEGKTKSLPHPSPPPPNTPKDDNSWTAQQPTTIPTDSKNTGMLVLKDITNDYDSPSIMDVKLGYTTVCDEYYPPEYPNRLQRLADRRAKDAETTAPHLGEFIPSTLYLTLSSLTKFGILLSS